MTNEKKEVENIQSKTGETNVSPVSFGFIANPNPIVPKISLRHHDGGRVAPGAGADGVAGAEAEPGIFAAGEAGELEGARIGECFRSAPRAAVRVERPLAFVTADVSRDWFASAGDFGGHGAVIHADILRRVGRLG